MEQGTIENASQPMKNKKKSSLTSFYATFQCGGYNVFKKNFNIFFAPENMKKTTLESCS